MSLETLLLSLYCTCEPYIIVFLLGYKICMYVFGKKRHVAHNAHTTSYLGPGFSYLRDSVCLMLITLMPTEFMNLRIKKKINTCSSVFNLGPRAVNMLQASRYLNPALVMGQ